MPFVHSLFPPDTMAGSSRESLSGLNLVLSSRDLRTTGPNWTASGSLSSATYDRTGLSGDPNTASNLVDNSGAGAAGAAQQSLTLDNTKIHTARIFISTATNIPVLWFNPGEWIGMDNSVSFTTSYFNGGDFPSTHVAYYHSPLYPGWVEMVCQFTPAAASVVLNVVPASSIGGIFGTSGSSSAQGNVTVGNIELYEDLRIEDVMGQPAEVNA